MWIPRLTDPADAAELYRLTIEPRDLGQPTTLVVCCDSDGHPVANMHLVECDPQPTPSECATVLEEVLARLDSERVTAYAGLSLGLTRPGGEQVQPYDKAWFRAFHRVSHRRGLTALGVYVVSRRGARAVHIDDAA